MSTKNAIAATLVQMSGDQNVVVVRKPFVSFTGSLAGGMMLNQLLYWTPRARIPGGWIAKSDKEFGEELCMSPYKVSEARKKLTHMGILETKLKKFAGAPTIHYRLKMDALMGAWTTELERLGIFARADQEDQAEPPKPPAPGPVPQSFKGYRQLLKEAPDKRAQIACLRIMIETLFPDHDPPEYSYVGWAMNKFGGAVLLAQKIWNASSQDVKGDNVLAYIFAMNNGKGNNGNRNRPRQKSATTGPSNRQPQAQGIGQFDSPPD